MPLFARPRAIAATETRPPSGSTPDAGARNSGKQACYLYTLHMAGPDHGLAVAILIAMAALVFVPAAILAGIGYAVGGDSKLVPTLIGGILGAALGAFAIKLMFYRDQIPMATIHLAIPTGFVSGWILLVEDPAAKNTLAYDGPHGEMSVRVPKSGVVRVKSLGELPQSSVEAVLSDGRTAQVWFVQDCRTGTVLGFGVEGKTPLAKLDGMTMAELDAFLRDKEHR